MQISKNHLKSRDDFLKNYISECKIEFCHLTEEWMDAFYQFAQSIMGALYDTVITGCANINVRDCIRIANDSPGVYYCGYPTVEYCYLVMTDEILDKKQASEKTNRELWKELLRQIQAKMTQVLSCSVAAETVVQ